MSECECIVQKVSFKVWRTKTWADRHLWLVPEHDIPLTIHAKSLTELEQKILEIKLQLETKYPDHKVVDFAE